MCDFMYVCICWRPTLNLPALIQAERANVNSSAGLMDRDKNDSQMERTVPGQSIKLPKTPAAV